MKKILLIIMVMFVITGCSNMKIENGKITCSEKDYLMDNNAVLIDVRTKDEYDTGHIEHAINIPYDEIVEKIDIDDKNTPIIVYCKSGKRSNAAYEALSKAGYTNLYDLGSIANCEK